MEKMRNLKKMLLIHAKGIGLILLVTAVLLAGCASGRHTLHKSPVEGEPVSINEAASHGVIVPEALKVFHVEILSQNSGICPGPDGKNMPYLGRDARLQVVLTFNRMPPGHIRPEHLSARLLHLNIPFVRQTSETRFITDVVDLNALEPGLEAVPQSVSIFYGTTGRDVFLGTGGRFGIDTKPPLKPAGVHILSQDGSTLLTWEKRPDRIKEYRIQKWDAGRWLTIGSGFGSPPLSIDPGTSARLRIVAVDCALNRSFSDDILVGKAGQMRLTRIGCGKNRYMAYSGAQVLINDGFVREYVSPWLKSNTTLTDGEVRVLITEYHEGWVPPGIDYTPENKASYYFEDGRWCTEVTGTLNRKFFDNWATQQLQELKR